MLLKKFVLSATLAVLSAIVPTFVLGQNAGLLEKPVHNLISGPLIRTVGPSSTGRSLSLDLVLPLRNKRQLDAFLQALSNPANPSYRHYLTPAEFTQMYGPNQADYDSLIAWAKSNGLTVTETPANRGYMGVSGSIGKINAVFNVTITDFVDSSTGRAFFAPNVEPTPATPIPLLAITGLDNAVPRIPQHIRLAPSKVGQNPVPMSDTGSGPSGTFTPSDMRAAYYGSGALSGSGQIVAIFSYDGYNASDLHLYYNDIGMTSNVYVSNVLVGGYNGVCTGIDGSGPCDDAEQVLDIANVAGMAPGINEILFYEGTSSTSVLNQIAEDDLASVVSSSWSGGDFGNASENPFKQMQAEGITYVNASGDYGAYATNPPAPDLSPSITEVGGTDLNTTGPGGSYVSETAWSGSGGGWIANTFSIPSFQQGAINSSNNGSMSWRNSPDISAEANYDNTTVSNGVFENPVAGTSYATPRWAGVIAMANQQATANCEPPVGFIPPTLYASLSTSAYSTSFHDITSGTNNDGSGVSYNAVADYDLVTGLGSPAGQNLINLLVPPHSSSTATEVNGIALTNGGPPETFSTRVTDFNGYPIWGGSVTFSYYPLGEPGNSTTACSANINNNNAENATCTAEVNGVTGEQYTLTASYSGTLYLGANACQASSYSETVISTGYGFSPE